MVDTQKLHQALREMGSEGLKQPYKDQWLRKRPTTGRCCFWQVKRGPPSAVQMGTTPGKNIYLSSHLSFSSSGSL